MIIADAPQVTGFSSRVPELAASPKFTEHISWKSHDRFSLIISRGSKSKIDSIKEISHRDSVVIWMTFVRCQIRQCRTRAITETGSKTRNSWEINIHEDCGKDLKKTLSIPGERSDGSHRALIDI
jgi:hypothetical protein